MGHYSRPYGNSRPFVNRCDASIDSRDGPDRGDRPPRRRRRGDARRPRGRRARRRGRRGGRRLRSGSRILRSSAKPFQALPLVRARDDLTTEEIAIASASHLASPEQLAAVRSLLAKAPADGGRARVRARTDAAPAQLLGQARRHARALPDEGLGERRLPARDAPGPARLPARGRCRGRRRRGRDPDRRRRVRRARPSRCRSSGWRSCSRGSSRSTAARGWRRRCALTRS